MKLISILFAQIILSSCALADVHTNNYYFTEGGGVGESVDLQNMDYSNSVTITQAALAASSGASLDSDFKDGFFEDNIVMSTRDNPSGEVSGADIRIGAQDQLGYSRSFSAGDASDNSTSLAYSLRSGQSAADYFTAGGYVHEDAQISNMSYVNRATIHPAAMVADADGSLVGGIKEGSINDKILLNPQANAETESFLIGTNLNARADGLLKFEKNFAAGYNANAEVSFAYVIGTGHANADYFNPSTSVNEDVLTKSSIFRSKVGVDPQKLTSSGIGSSSIDAPGGFGHEIGLTYSNTPSLINASLVSGDEKYGLRADLPVQYRWDTYVDSNENRALSGIDIKAIDGNRDVDMIAVGTAAGFKDKYAGPVHLVPSGFIRFSKELYMSFELSK